MVFGLSSGFFFTFRAAGAPKGGGGGGPPPGGGGGGGGPPPPGGGGGGGAPAPGGGGGGGGGSNASFFFQGKIKELVHLFDSSHLPQLEEALEWPQEEEEGLNSSRLPVDESNRQSVDANRQSASRNF